MAEKSLRPHQETAIAMLRASLASGKRRPVLALATGGGKTLVATRIIQGARAKGKRVTFTVPVLSLVTQTFESFVENGVDPGEIGVIQGDHGWRRPHAPIQIASVQTLARRGFPETDFVICDEAHLNFEVIHNWIKDSENKIFIGLSATPWSRGMGDIWDDLIIPTTLSELIELGWLCKFRVFAAATKADLSGVKTVAGDYHEGQLSDVMSNKVIVADVVSTWLEKGENRQTICFAVDRAHAATLHEQFEAAGVGSAYIDGETPCEERQAILERYKRGEVNVICSVGTMTTGVDIPCQCIVDAQPTRSEIRHCQKIGRGLRNEEGKTDLKVLDHAGNCQRLGMPTSIGRTTLRTAATDAKEAKEGETLCKEPLPRECRSCNALVPAKTRVCPSCGAEMKRHSNVETVDGELVEFGSAPVKGGKKSAIDRLRDQGKQAIYSQLWAEGKGEKFVLAKYKAIFETWPRNLVRMPLEPSAELRSWLHSERIKWAKSKQNTRNSGSATAEDSRGLANVD